MSSQRQLSAALTGLLALSAALPAMADEPVTPRVDFLAIVLRINIAAMKQSPMYRDVGTQFGAYNPLMDPELRRLKQVIGVDSDLDLDGVAVGWTGDLTRSGGSVFGAAWGRFDKPAIEQRAADLGLTPTQYGDTTVCRIEGGRDPSIIFALGPHGELLFGTLPTPADRPGSIATATTEFVSAAGSTTDLLAQALGGLGEARDQGQAQPEEVSSVVMASMSSDRPVTCARSRMSIGHNSFLR